MKRLIIFLAAAVCFTLAAAPAPATAPSALDNVLAAIQAKIKSGQNTQRDLAPEIKQLDALLAARPGDKSDDAAKIAYARAKLYGTTLHEYRAALPMYQKIVADYPGTPTAKEVAEAIPALEKKIENDAVHSSLAVGTQFPDFAVQDLDGKPLSPANYRGKILLIEFWATWCPDCQAQMPHILSVYNRFHARGFDIIGVSLDQDDRRVLLAYLRDNKIPWPQYYDGKYWNNALALKYGVKFTPQNYLLNGEGIIIGKELQGAALDQAVEKALAANSSPK